MPVTSLWDFNLSLPVSWKWRRHFHIIKWLGVRFVLQYNQISQNRDHSFTKSFISYTVTKPWSAEQLSRSHERALTNCPSRTMNELPYGCPTIPFKANFILHIVVFLYLKNTHTNKFPVFLLDVFLTSFSLSGRLFVKRFALRYWTTVCPAYL